MTATIPEIITKIRRNLDEVTLTGELVVTDEDMNDLASSNFSDTDLEDRILDAARYIAARVKAVHIPNLLISVTPQDFDLQSPVQILRLVGSRVYAQNTSGEDVLAMRRTFASHLKLENRGGLAADENNPVYVYQDFELLIDNGADHSGTPRSAQAVSVPTSLSDVTGMPDKFEAALIQHVVMSCFETLRMGELSKAARNRLMRELQPYLLIRYDLISQESDQQPDANAGNA